MIWLIRRLLAKKAELLESRETIRKFYDKKSEEVKLSNQARCLKLKVLGSLLKSIHKKHSQKIGVEFLRNWYSKAFFVNYSERFDTDALRKNLERFNHVLGVLESNKENMQIFANDLRSRYQNSEEAKAELLSLISEKEKLSLCLSDRLSQLEAIRKENLLLKGSLAECKKESEELIEYGMTYLNQTPQY